MVPNRDVSLIKRSEENWGKTSKAKFQYKEQVAVFNLIEIYEHFLSDLNEIDKLTAVSDSLIGTGNFDAAKNILRSQIVFLESILDFYIHELTKYALVEIFKGNWIKTNPYKAMSVPMQTLEVGLSEIKNSYWFVEYINERFSHVTFLDNTVIAQQFSLLGLNFKDICKTASLELPRCNKNLKLIFERRNKIAHQSDRSYASAKKNDISSDFVKMAACTIGVFVKHTHEAALKKEDKVV